jgi:PhnB protein
MEKIELAPYIFFKGNCAEAMEFYKNVFGGKLEVQKYEDVPGDFPGKSEMTGKIMNSSLETPGGFVIRASDANAASPEAKKIELCLTGSDEENLRKIFDDLSSGGKVVTPLEKMFWGDVFGQLKDKFGVDWMVDITTGQQA